MNSPLPDNFRLLAEENSAIGKTNEMSPVTNLAFNMESLSTSFMGTPNRRISWSNPFPDDSDVKGVVEGFSPCTDSPMFQEISHRGKSKLKINKVSRKVLLSNQEEKENVAPEIDMDLNIKKNSESDNMYENDSQDSGYADMCMQHFGITAIDSTPRMRSRSSLFTDEDEDGFESLMQMDDDDDDQEILCIPNMKSLLTLPLHDDVQCESTSNSITKLGKLPIRRCLSMEMECISESQSKKLQIISKSGTLLATSNTQSDLSTNVEPSQKCPFKRPEPPNIYYPLQNKRRKSSPSVTLCEGISEATNFTFKRSFSETAATIMHAVLKADLQPDLIGDCSKNYVLPLVKGRHQDLKCISPHTLAKVIRGEYSQEIDTYILVDCR